MTIKFYIGLASAISVLVLILFVAPYLRLRQRRKKMETLEAWYKDGPLLSAQHSVESYACDLCGHRALKKGFVGSVERAGALGRRINPQYVDEARYYEYRCSKCNSVAFKEKVPLEA